METLLVASADRDPSIRMLLDGALDGIPDNPLVNAIGKVNPRPDRAGMARGRIWTVVTHPT